MATEKFISFLSCRAFLPVICRLARIAQALQGAAYLHHHDESLKSLLAPAESACRQLAAHARQGGAV